MTANSELISGAIEHKQEYLSFLLNQQEFGVDILTVKEIRVWSEVTKIPNTPDYIQGVINLRGVIVPIVDLSLRFGRDSQSYNQKTVVIILSKEINGRELSIGIIVDAVSEVYQLSSGEILEHPDFGEDIDTDFITGVATIEDNLVVVLDSEKLLSNQHIYAARESAIAV